jgi:hypothetical protein
LELRNIRRRARRRGFFIEHGQHSDSWTLVEAQTKRPVWGLVSVSFAQVAREIVALKSAPAKKVKKPASRPTKKSPSGKSAQLPLPLPERAPEAPVPVDAPVAPFSVSDFIARSRRIFRD